MWYRQGQSCGIWIRYRDRGNSGRLAQGRHVTALRSGGRTGTTKQFKKVYSGTAITGSDHLLGSCTCNNHQDHSIRGHQSIKTDLGVIRYNQLSYAMFWHDAILAWQQWRVQYVYRGCQVTVVIRILDLTKPATANAIYCVVHETDLCFSTNSFFHIQYMSGRLLTGEYIDCL